MNQLLYVRLKWFDDSTLGVEDSRALLELFLSSLGVSSQVAADILEVLMEARAQDVGVTTKEIKRRIIEKRKERGENQAKKGLTERNIQKWLCYFRELNLIDRFGKRYRFKGNKLPSEAFEEYTLPLIHETTHYIKRVLEKVEKKYGIEKL